jgi:hypothetical protein
MILFYVAHIARDRKRLAFRVYLLRVCSHEEGSVVVRV